MAIVILTRVEILSRVRLKLRDNQIESSDIYAWMDDVLQKLTGEVLFDELRSVETTLTGTGLVDLFDLPVDFHKMSWMRDPVTGQYLDEVHSREMVEEYSSPSTSVSPPCAYAILGRTGTVTNLLPAFQIKFDNIPASAYVLKYEYYRLHPKLDTDSVPIQLPVTLASMIVDGVLIEADSWNDSDQFMMHRDRFESSLKSLKRNYHRSPNRVRRIGGASRSGRPGHPTLPWNY